MHFSLNGVACLDLNINDCNMPRSPVAVCCQRVLNFSFFLSNKTITVKIPCELTGNMALQKLNRKFQKENLSFFVAVDEFSKQNCGII